MCDELRKKSKRSFQEAWLSNDRVKSWIRQVSSDDSLYHCTVCNKNFSCNTYILKHADSACHINNIKKNTLLNNTESSHILNNNNESLHKKRSNKFQFQQQWLEIALFKPWLREVSHDKNSFFCLVCEKSMIGDLSHIYRHAESEAHIKLCKKKEIGNTDEDIMNDSRLLFDERKRSAEIQYAALIAEKNIPHQTAKEILNFFKHIGQDPNVLQKMSMGRTKCKNIISNVLCSVESQNVANNLKHTKFSIFIDETSDICNEKWMTFFVRYIDPETLDIRSQLVKLINIDARDCSSEKLFNAFKSEMWKLQIPFSNIIAMSCDNASVMTGKHLSFKTKLQGICKHLLTFPCPCHSAALAAHAACAKIPSFCDEFLRKIASYINGSPKRSAIFQEFCECFQEKYRKILKLSDTRWLSHHTCVERLLQSWDTIKHFLEEMVVSEKTQSGEYLLSMMNNIEIKAYFLFLQYILNFFNAFNAFFQSTETRIHLLQIKAVTFLIQVCENFIKKEYLKDVTIQTNMNFSQKENQKDIDEIFLGPECEEYLNNLIIDGHADTVLTVRQNCLQFYLSAAEEIRKRLPIRDNFLIKLKVFRSSICLFDDNREASFQHVSFVAKTLGGFDEESLKKEWFALPADLTLEEKENISKLNFDDMWKKILQRQSNNTYKYPTLRKVLSAVRALPNSNADPERTFSVLTDLKSKKRNKLSSASVNATCVIRSAFKTRGETAINMTVTEEHLSRMAHDKLYAACPKKEKNSLTLYAADEDSLSSTT